MGEYVIEETKVPEGYLIDGTHQVTLEKTSSKKELEMKNVLSQEQVIKGQLEIAKSGHSGESGVVPGLEGIEFTMKLKVKSMRKAGIKPRLTV
ncbi:MAG: SpaA isopeptide-forming pilin-related protein [Coprobacillus cateniformis]